MLTAANSGLISLCIDSITKEKFSPRKGFVMTVLQCGKESQACFKF